MGATLDMTFRIGDLITVVGLFGGGIMVIAYMRSDMRLMGQRLGAVENMVDTFMKSMNQKMDVLTSILVEQAKHDERLIGMERRVSEIGSVMMQSRPTTLQPPI